MRGSAMADFKEGDACGLYQIVRPLGAGGMGTVYQALHRIRREQVALKYLSHVREDDAQAVRKLVREVEMIALINSPNIVNVLDLGFHEGMGFLVMELCTGTNLRRYMQAEELLPLADVLYVARGIAVGLENAHHHSVLHRDVKPENVQITADYEVKLLDFGASRRYRPGQNSTDRMKIIGTPHYMSPEHLRGLKIDGRSDLFALGVILYEMLAKRHPFDAGGEPLTAEEIGQIQVCASPASLRSAVGPLPRGLEELTLKLLAKDRDQRFGDALEVAERLDTFLQDVLALGKAGKLVKPDLPGSGLRTKGGRGHVRAESEDVVVRKEAVAGGRAEQGATVELHRKEVASTEVTLEVPRGAMLGSTATAASGEGGTLKLPGVLPSPSSGVDTGRGVPEADWLEAARVPVFYSSDMATRGLSKETAAPSKEAVQSPQAVIEGRAGSARGSVKHGRRRRLRWSRAERGQGERGRSDSGIEAKPLSRGESHVLRVFAFVLGAAVFGIAAALGGSFLGLSGWFGGERGEARQPLMFEALAWMAAAPAPPLPRVEASVALSEPAHPAPSVMAQAREGTAASASAQPFKGAPGAAAAPKKGPAAPRPERARMRPIFD